LYRKYPQIEATAKLKLKGATKFYLFLEFFIKIEVYVFFLKKILRKNLKKLENFEKNLEIFFYDKSRNAFCGLLEAIWCSYYVPNLN
jgi:hypothetical protein